MGERRRGTAAVDEDLEVEEDFEEEEKGTVTDDAADVVAEVEGLEVEIAGTVAASESAGKLLSSWRSKEV